MIEINGQSEYVGELTRGNSLDASFTYADSYLRNPEHRPISISLPLKEKSFDAARTRNFFEGLLPEGFTRKCVAKFLHADESDYVSILSGLGKECLGAISILDESEETLRSEYRELTQSEVQALASEGATESAELVTKAHLSLTGASGKAGLYYLEEEGKWYLPVGAAPSTHIVKQSHVRLKKIVANEQLCLLTAGKLGIDIPESFIVKTAGNEEEVLFATKRYDRLFKGNNRHVNGLPIPRRLHQEDFAQALGIAPADKYERDGEEYMRKLFELVRTYSAEPIRDSLRLWDICVYNYLVGNTDNHIKNLSLLYSADLKALRLAPAYDIVSTVIYESSSEDMALGIGGVTNLYEIKRENFEKAAREAGLGAGMAMKRFDAMAGRFREAINHAAEELKLQGFGQAELLRDEILRKGGIRSIR